jgi:para-nitrobenzyl esterase
MTGREARSHAGTLAKGVMEALTTDTIHEAETAMPRSRTTLAPTVLLILGAASSGCASAGSAAGAPDAVGAATAVPPTTAAPEDDTVRIAAGLLAGTRAAGDPDVRVFRGIPFAAPPVGELRWRPPEPAATWSGVREAVEFSPACPQELPGLRLPWTEAYMHQGTVSEDCLYLNVWTAAGSGDARRPVFVYIHGGGFSEGSGSVALYDGTVLAQKGLVVVTVNYRLGALGFLAHPALTAEPPAGSSGNYGLLDQVAALEWVRDNIAVMGGDPRNVTIAGQSAGGMSVYLLTASPLAAGLFHRAIVESGPGGLASFGIPDADALTGSLAEAEAAGERFAKARGAATAEALRDLSIADLVRGGAGEPGGEGDAGEEGAGDERDEPPVRFGPIVDGRFLPASASAVYATGRHNDVPMVMGFNADEASAFPGYHDGTGERSPAALRDQAARALTRLAEERAATSDAPTYLYYFERAIPWPEHPEFGAFHSGELPYVFGTLDRLDRPWTVADRALADAVTSWWGSFATTGDPNVPGLAEWPSHEEAPGAFLVLDDTIEVRTLPAEADRPAAPALRPTRPSP